MTRNAQDGSLLIPFILLVTALTLFQWFLPWWSAFLVSMGIFYVWQNERVPVFLVAFAAGALIWLAVAWMKDAQSGGVVRPMLSSLLGSLPGWAVLLITAVLGGLISGLGAQCGRLARKAVAIEK